MAKMVVSYRDEIMFVDIPDDEQHMVSVVVEPEALDIYLDGQPVDTMTGQTAEKLVSSKVITLADDLVRMFESTEVNLVKLAKTMDAYKQIRGGNFSPAPVKSNGRRVTPLAPPVIDLADAEVDGDGPEPGGEKGQALTKEQEREWGAFVADIQKRTGRGENVACGCGTLITSFIELKQHWLDGHDLKPKTKSAASSYMPQREGPSSD